MSYPQYGVYLIPPPPLLYQIGLAHQLLAANFNARVAGNFMVHCTIKGFFKLAEGASPADFIPALDKLFAGTAPVETEFKELWKIREGGRYRSSILLAMERTEALHQLHNQVWDIVRPCIAPDCIFSPVEPAGPNFPPHVTLVMDYSPAPGIYDQAVNLCEYLFERHLRGNFVASEMQLIEFYSDDWPGDWGNTLRYKQLKGWQLGKTAQ